MRHTSDDYPSNIESAATQGFSSFTMPSTQIPDHGSPEMRLCKARATTLNLTFLYFITYLSGAINMEEVDIHTGGPFGLPMVQHKKRGSGWTFVKRISCVQSYPYIQWVSAAHELVKPAHIPTEDILAHSFYSTIQHCPCSKYSMEALCYWPGVSVAVLTGVK